MASLFPSEKFFVIAGPCVVEDDALNLTIARELERLSSRVPGGIIFKASFDKANRSNRAAHRGPGLGEGLKALQRVKNETGMSVITDVHLPEQCASAAEVADALQIPAFLCRQTDLLQAAGATGRAVNVKKGQWLHPEGMRGAVDKVRGSGATASAREVARRRVRGWAGCGGFRGIREQGHLRRDGREAGAGTWRHAEFVEVLAQPFGRAVFDLEPHAHLLVAGRRRLDVAGGAQLAQLGDRHQPGRPVVAADGKAGQGGAERVRTARRREW